MVHCTLYKTEKLLMYFPLNPFKMRKEAKELWDKYELWKY